MENVIEISLNNKVDFLALLPLSFLHLYFSLLIIPLTIKSLHYFTSFKKQNKITLPYLYL